MTSLVADLCDRLGDMQSGVSAIALLMLPNLECFTLNQAFIVQFKLISVIASQRFTYRIISNITKYTSYLLKKYYNISLSVISRKRSRM